MSKLALRAPTVDIADLALRQDLSAKKRFNARSKEFLFGQRPVENGLGSFSVDRLSDDKYSI